MMSYRVSKEILLDIAEYCDRKTLLSLLQTNKVSQLTILGLYTSQFPIAQA